MVTPHFRPEVEIWWFRALTIEICNISPIYGQIAENCHILKEIVVDEHNGDVNFQTQVEI